MRPPTLVERVVDCSGGDEISEESGFLRKAESLVTLLAQEKRPRTLIFCNKILTCRKVLLWGCKAPTPLGLSQHGPCWSRSSKVAHNAAQTCRVPNNPSAAASCSHSCFHCFRIPVSTQPGRLGMPKFVPFTWSSVLQVENYLKRNAAKTGPAEAPVSVLPCHSAIEDGARTANLKAFLTAQDQTPMALVCTDRASRGLDSSCCSHVVLFDFPRDPSEYMRRCGVSMTKAPDLCLHH